MPTIKDNIPNLLPGEIAYALEAGELVTVRVEQRPLQNEHVAVVVSGRLIEKDGSDKLLSTALHPEPAPVRLPASAHSIQLAALGEDLPIVRDTVARGIAEALAQWPRFLLGLASLRFLPVEAPAART